MILNKCINKMDNSITLCYLAYELGPGQEPEDYHNLFEFNDKSYESFFPFETYKEEIFSFENGVDMISNLHKSTLSIELCEQSNLKILTLKYNGNPPTRHVDFLHNQFFNMIFWNHDPSYYSSVDSDSMDGNRRRNLRQEYLTMALYDALYKRHYQEIAAFSPPPPPNIPALPECFRPTLCAFQERTVEWLLKRENEPTRFPAYYKLLQARDNEHAVYKHLLSIHFEACEPPAIELAPGGILADEMGLGKTVEMLALIVLHTRKLPKTIINYKMEDGDGDDDGPRMKRPRPQANELFCICTNKTKTKNKLLLQCKRCTLQQHAECVSRFDEKGKNNAAADEMADGEKEDDRAENKKETQEEEEDYLCPSCWYEVTQKESPLPVATTFIVTPNTIKTQWLAEIQRHIRPTLKVFDYNELAAANWISPRELGRYDVVITDYNVLTREIYHTSAYLSERVTRHAKRSMRRMSPLLMVQWWRVCLDEAQMVESNTSKAAAMVRQLPAVNRWAVTGTPIQRSLDDLRGLLEFIGFNEPLTPLSGWKSLLDDFGKRQNGQTAYCRIIDLTLVDVLQRCMWRTCKSKISDELQIPTQTEKVHHIQLSNLEKLFYSEQHALCESSFREVLRKHLDVPAEWRDAKLSLNPKIMQMLLQPLLSVRQCCIIPVVNAGLNAGQSKTTTTAAQQKQFMQPKDLHTHLKSTNEVECKSELRTMASSYNGMAAIYFIRGNYEQAIKNYEMVLRLARDYKAINITVDSLLQIHALHNIQQAFYTEPSNAQLHAKAIKSTPNTSAATNSTTNTSAATNSTTNASTSTNSNLNTTTTTSSTPNISSTNTKITPDSIARYESDCNALEWKYLEPYALSMQNTQTACTLAQETLAKLESTLEQPLPEFISLLTDEIAEQKEIFAITLLNRFHDEFTTTFAGNAKMEELNSVAGMFYVIVMWHEKIEAAQKYLNGEFEKLQFYTMNVSAEAKSKPAVWRKITKFIRSVYECHLSEILDDKKDEDKEKSKSKPKKSKNRLCKLCQIRNALNDYECLLFNKVVDEETNMTDGLENPAFEVALIKVLFHSLRNKAPFLTYAQQCDKHWEAIESYQQLCKKFIKYWIEIEYTVKAYDELDMCKMRISLAASEEEKTHFKLLDYELDNTLAEQQLNLHNAQRQFAMKLARLKYITHLASDAATANPCPICHADEDQRYAVLECGHNVCIECLRTLRKHKAQQKFCCPICRNAQSSEKIYYVTRTANTPNAYAIEVKGDYSSKITYIVRLILQLQQEHANDVQPLKILVFSQWSEILIPIATAFTENGIRHRLNLTPRTIEEFKNPNLGITCLLMPLRKGCNGLNLIQATHVFLVEPILNPGEEAQAIGRVHRFGQTRTTTVHRFIVCNTIEENIYNAVTVGKQSEPHWAFKQTANNLEDLFRLDNDISDDYIP